jgi:hypothetical protein
MVSVLTSATFSRYAARLIENQKKKKKANGKAIPLQAMEVLGGRGGIAPTHSRPRH